MSQKRFVTEPLTISIGTISRLLVSELYIKISELYISKL